METKRGRPRKKEAKRERVVVRLSEQEADKMNEICVSTGKNLSEVVRAALDLYHKTYEYL